MKTKKFYLRGQAMVEAVVAFGVVMVVLVALLQLSNRSVVSSGAANRQAVATGYVTAGLQWLKQERIKNSLNEGLLGHCPSGTCNYCLNNLDWGNDCSVTNIAGTEYSRRLTLNSSVTDQVTATVAVSWQESGRTVTATQTFTFVKR